MVYAVNTHYYDNKRSTADDIGGGACVLSHDLSKCVYAWVRYVTVRTEDAFDELRVPRPRGFRDAVPYGFRPADYFDAGLGPGLGRI